MGKSEPSKSHPRITCQHSLARGSGLPRRQMRRRFRSRGFIRGEGFHKSLFETINVFEIFDRIVLGFSEYTCADQIKDNVPNVLTRMDSPAIEDRHHHRSEFLQRIPPYSIEQLRAAHVTNADAFDFLLLLRRKVERVA